MTNGTTTLKPFKWLNKSVYFENVSGYKIIEEQDKLNTGDTFVVATQVFPIANKLALRPDGSTHQGYDAFIYYKQKVNLENAGELFTLGKDGNTVTKYDEIIEDKTMDIVIP